MATKVWHTVESKFELGQLVFTVRVLDRTEEGKFREFVIASLRRHAKGDWGDMCQEDKAENELSLRQGHLRIFSAYEAEGLPKIWIITEADRSATTILFPEEY